MTSQLKIRMGSAPGASFRVKVAGGEIVVDQRGQHVIEGHVDQFTSIAVLSGGNGLCRLFILVPGDREEDVQFEGFFVSGCFRIESKTNNPVRAREEWKLFARKNLGASTEG